MISARANPDALSFCRQTDGREGKGRGEGKDRGAFFLNIPFRLGGPWGAGDLHYDRLGIGARKPLSLGRRFCTYPYLSLLPFPSLPSSGFVLVS